MKPNIVFLIIDSFRSDKFFHTSTTSKKPNLDNLIERGTYFSNTVSTADATILSWSSIFTGQFPFRTGIRSTRLNKLDKNTKTIFHYLKKFDYSFYGFIPTFSDTIGLFPNFKNKNYLYDFTSRLYSGLDSKILDTVSSLPNTKPWLLTIHLMDLHFPLLVPKNFDNEQFGFSKYEKIISSIDVWLGKLIQNIDFENTIMIITSDHGSYVKKIKKNSDIIDFEDDGEKELFKKTLSNKIPAIFKPIKNKIFFSIENKKKNSKSEILSKYDLTNHEKRTLLSGQYSIDHFLYDDIIHVPLLFVGKNIPKNQIYSEQVSLVDLLPTLINLIENNFDDSLCDGRNLFPIKSEIDSVNPAYIESNPMIDLKSNDVIGIRTNNFKYFRDKNSKNNRVHLYDLLKDPMEENNCASTNQSEILKMEQILQNLLNSNKNEIKTQNELTSDEIENELRKMGYV